MRVPFLLLDWRDAARALGAHQWALRGLLVLATALVLVALSQSGDESGWWAVLVLVAAAWTAYKPDSVRPALLIGMLMASWFVGGDEDDLGWSLVAAVGLLLVHASAAYAAETPPGGSPARSTHRRWTLQTLVVTAMTAAVWAMAEGFSGVRAPGRTVVTAAALVGVLVMVLALALGTRPADSPAAVRPDRER
jgi:hypothetical protein